MNQEYGFIIEDEILVEYNGYEENIVLPNGIKEIDEAVFRESYGLKSIVIPEGVERIGKSAFYFCDVMSEVVLPTSLIKIENRAFGCCNSLANIVIPQNVNEIGVGAFMACSSLKSISVHLDNKFFYSEGGVLFEKRDGEIILVACPAGIGETYTIPEGTTVVGNYAFYGCKNLSTLIIPESVIAIGKSAFLATAGLRKIEFPSMFEGGDKEDFAKRSKVEGGLTIVDTLWKRKQKSNKKSVFTTAEEILEWDKQNKAKLQGEFTHCDKEQVGYFAVPEGTKTIQSHAFMGCKNLTEIYIPDGVKIIGTGAFQYCENLTRIRIPNSVTFIGEFAFDGCDKLSIIVGESVLDNDPLVPIENGHPIRATRTRIFQDETQIKVVAFPKMKLRPYNYPIKWLMSLALGFLAYPELYDSCDFEYADEMNYISYIEYVKRYERKLLSYIFENDLAECLKFFAEYKVMTSKNFKTKFLDKAINKGAVKCQEYLSNVVVTAETKNQALKEIKNKCNEPLTDKVVMKDWTYFIDYSANEEILCLTEYIGRDKDIKIPESIDGRMVKEIYASLLESNYSYVNSITIPRSVNHIDFTTFDRHANVLIRGYKNSYVKDFALKNGLKFEEIADD